MDGLLSPVILYTLCAVGAVGVCVALPRRGVNPQILGALLGAAALGGAMLALGLAYRDSVPNVFFYVFAFIGLGAALRVISHPRPVYAALYFILTILASSGLYVLLSAEFLAFALIIVYAGAILITYLFVIMLATETPSADEVDALAEYDRISREPIVATAMGFVLVAVLCTLMGRGVRGLTPPTVAADAALLEMLPKKAETALREAKLIEPGEWVVRGGELSGTDLGEGRVTVEDAGGGIRTIGGALPAGLARAGDDEARGAILRGARLMSEGETIRQGGPVKGVDIGAGTIRVWTPDGRTRTIARSAWPGSIRSGVSNVEGVADELLNGHPGAIEMAGVVLLMAMLGAVVLARKKVEMDDAAKLAMARRRLVTEGGNGGAA